MRHGCQDTEFLQLRAKAGVLGEVPEDSRMWRHMEAELVHLNDARMFELRRGEEPATDIMYIAVVVQLDCALYSSFYISIL